MIARFKFIHSVSLPHSSKSELTGGRLLELSLDLCYLWDLSAGPLRHQKGLVVPFGLLANGVELAGHSRPRVDLDRSFPLGLFETLEIVCVAFVVGHKTQHIIQGEFRKGYALVHRIEVVGVEGGDQLTDQMKAL
jgi:hypothetical protein